MCILWINRWAAALNLPYFCLYAKTSLHRHTVTIPVKSYSAYSKVTSSSCSLEHHPERSQGFYFLLTHMSFWGNNLFNVLPCPLNNLLECLQKCKLLMWTTGTCSKMWIKQNSSCHLLYNRLTLKDACNILANKEVFFLCTGLSRLCLYWPFCVILNQCIELYMSICSIYLSPVIFAVLVKHFWDLLI